MRLKLFLFRRMEEMDMRFGITEEELDSVHEVKIE